MKHALPVLAASILIITLTGCGDTPKISGINNMVTLGDSISVATDSCGLSMQCPGNSWSTGTDINSHATRIDAAENIKILAQNDAVPGARIADLAAQIQTAINQRPNYITILIGANDFCTPNVDTMTDPTVFQTTLNQDLATLTAALPQTKILITSLPNPMNLWSAAKDNTRAQEVWQYAGFCQSLLANPTDTSPAATARRQTVSDRAAAFNTAIGNTCNLYPTQCHYDGGVVYSYKFDISELSDVDYFHPSAKGQEKLADLTWHGGGAAVFLAG